MIHGIKSILNIVIIFVPVRLCEQGDGVGDAEVQSLASQHFSSANNRAQFL